ncbi:LysE family transporter [Paenibacillus sp. Marseille-Q4541]|uniref:LysE/ArgO family amino acid transporter n=1 Tax=Paenibacillus sp. Marseille-Q4541 TaxID=2831522 RepID=UPI001BAB9456|nr:LysE family transporter [Paenibacillus sp. Marseille-Q4541]
MQEAIIHALILAAGLILPLGAQNLFVFNQGATQKNWAGSLPAVVTAALCDTILIVLAVGGLSLLLSDQSRVTQVIYAAGCLFLIYMAWTMWRAGGGSKGKQQALTGRQQILFALSVSILNPHAILDILGVIGTNSLQYEGTERTAYTVVTILVSWVWFILLATAGRIMGRWDQTGTLSRWLGKVSSLTMAGLALYMLYSLVQSLQ